MSKNYYVGLSREQIEKLLNGEEVGKRPYDDLFPMIRYQDKRIFIKMLSEEEKSEEPETAFNW